ncbi:MAG TPA: type II toxin-antitoxin system VapC family toxin [Solirubrobacteraceae bacterium]|jgi:predicted nucleic acid-binding protein|nr:type II toxin-antitoxin system VapC family toxin [Solirubrobacteraceae bacterium]
MIVVDASAAISALMNAGAARQTFAGEQLHAPHLIDTEVASGLRRQAASGICTPDDAWSMLAVWRDFGLTRYPAFAMLDRIWELRENLSAYDACYVALAELLDCPLVTADKLLSRAPGIRCAITTVPG